MAERRIVRRKSTPKVENDEQASHDDLQQDIELTWLRARYAFHTFAYRDPRAAYSSAPALPVVSPTTVVLGIASTLFSLGMASEAKAFLEVAHRCQVMVDAPDGVVFFRAFHKVR